MNYSGVKSFTDILPDGDKIFSEYFQNPIKGGSDYLIDPIKGNDGVTSGFLIYENNGDKSLADRQANGTVVTVDQAKAGNWNPETNTLDTSKSYSVPSSGSSSTGSSSSTGNRVTGGSLSSKNGIAHVESGKIDEYEQKIKKDFEKINESLRQIKSQLEVLNNSGIQSPEINTQIKGLIKSINKRVTWNSNKYKMIANNIDKDMEFAAAIQATIEQMTQQFSGDVEKLQAQAEQQ